MRAGSELDAPRETAIAPAVSRQADRQDGVPQRQFARLAGDAFPHSQRASSAPRDDRNHRGYDSISNERPPKSTAPAGQR